MPEIILITLAKNIVRILKNKVKIKKIIKGVHPPMNLSPMKVMYHLSKIHIIKFLI